MKHPVLIALCFLALLANPANAQTPYSPTETGAKCDGKTDDTAAIDTWWSHLMRHGGAGTLPAGICVARPPWSGTCPGTRTASASPVPARASRSSTCAR